MFGPGGERIPHDAFYTISGDGCCDIEDYPERYVGQMTYLNQLLMSEIEEILRVTDGNAVIILHGDHGPGGYLDWRHPSPSAIHDRMAILLAAHLPEGEDDAFYPSVTPVNIFRIILDRTFGGGLGLLEDASYFTSDEGVSEAIRVEPSGG